MTYTSRSDVELEQLAQDIVGGNVWSNYNHKADPEIIRMTFMPIAFMAVEDIEALAADNITFLYEYLHKAGPMAVNGMPVFFSMSVLDKTDADKLHQRVQALDAINRQRMEEAGG